MLVKELIELLQTLPQDSIVVLSADSEGNNFSPLADHSDQYNYEADSTYSGELRDPQEWLEECDGDEDEPCPGVPCVVLWPTN